MRTRDHIQCSEFPCPDVKHDGYVVNEIDLNPEDISAMLISEAAPPYPVEAYYSGVDSLFQQTTVQAFKDAGAPVSSIQDLLDLGIYLTTAVKCGKTGYGIQRNTISACSCLLEKELALFPDVQVFLLMGDVAIQAFNMVAKRMGAGRVIPAGATYKIRGKEYYFRGKRVFPSYLQAGPSFFIEKTKRKMISEDIAMGLDLINKLAASGSITYDP